MSLRKMNPADRDVNTTGGSLGCEQGFITL